MRHSRDLIISLARGCNPDLSSNTTIVEEDDVYVVGGKISVSKMACDYRDYLHREKQKEQMQKKWEEC
jgi:hypothetical protein